MLPAVTPRAVPIALAGAAVGLLPWQWGAPAAAGLLVFLTGLARPRLPLYCLGLAALLSSVREVRLGPVGVTATELLLFVGLAAWLIGAAARREPLRLSAWAAPVAVFVLLGLVSTSWVISLPAALKELLRWIELGAAMLVAAALIENRRQAALLIGVVLVGGIVESAIGAVQFFLRIGPPSFAVVGGFFRAHGTFGQPNPFGGYLEMVLPIALALVVALVRPRWLWLLALAALATTGVALAMSFSRGAWLGIVVGLVAMMLAAGPRTLAAVAVAGLIAALVALLGSFEVLPVWASERIEVLTRYFGVFDARNVRLNAENFGIVERMAHWQAAYEMWLSRPWFGMGIGQYAVAYPDFQIATWKDPLGHAHNYYLNVLAEVGTPGLAVFLAMVLSWLALAGRRVHQAHSPLGRAVAIGVFGVLAAVSAHNLFDNLFVSGLNVHLGLLLGVAAGLPRWERLD